MRDEPAPPIGLGQLVREYVLPYNTLFAVSGVLAFVLGMISPWLVLGSGAVLLCLWLLWFALDLLARGRLATWAHRPDSRRHLARNVSCLLWPADGGSARGSGLFWAVLIVGFGVSLFGLKGVRDTHLVATAGAPAPVQDAVASRGRFSIVVLPFENMSHDADQEFFADGITEDLTTDLSRIDDSFVIARNTAFTYKGKNIDVRRIGKELGVNYAIEGSVQKIGSSARVRVQLVDTRTDAHVWADRFDSELSQLPAMRDKITAQVANSVNLKVVEAERERLERTRPANPQAAELVMRAKAAENRPSSAKNHAEALKYFGEALQLDARNVAALTGLGFAHAEGALYGWAADRRDALRQARSYLDRAADIDPDRPDIYLARCIVLLNGGSAEELLAAAEHVIELDPNSAFGQFLVGQANIQAGHPERAFPFFEKAIALSPIDPRRGIMFHGIGYAHLHLAHYEQAAEWEGKAIAAGDHRWQPYASLAAANAQLGRLPQAQAALEQARKSNPKLSLHFLEVTDAYRTPAALAQRNATLVAGLRKAGLQ